MVTPNRQVGPGSPEAPILIVEDDRNLAAAMVDVLSIFGFPARAVSVPDKAVAHLERDPFSLVLTDYRFSVLRDTERAAVDLLEAARPVPVGCITGTSVPESLRGRYAFVIGKPFAPEELLASVAPFAAVRGEDPAQQLVIEAYFRHLSALEWNHFGALLTPSVTYHVPQRNPYGRAIAGRDPFLRYSEELFRTLPRIHFQLRHIVWLPRGAVAHYHSTWRAGTETVEQSGAVLFAFEGDLVSEIGVRFSWQG